MKTFAIAAVLALTASAALAQPPAAPAAPAAAAATKYSGATTVAVLVRTPATKAVLAKTMPDALAILEMYIDMIPADLTLQALQEQFGDMIGVTKEVLDATNAELAKLT